MHQTEENDPFFNTLPVIGQLPRKTEIDFADERLGDFREVFKGHKLGEIDSLSEKSFIVWTKDLVLDLVWTLWRQRAQIQQLRTQIMGGGLHVQG